MDGRLRAIVLPGEPSGCKGTLFLVALLLFCNPAGFVEAAIKTSISAPVGQKSNVQRRAITCYASPSADEPGPDAAAAERFLIHCSLLVFDPHSQKFLEAGSADAAEGQPGSSSLAVANSDGCVPSSMQMVPLQESVLLCFFQHGEVDTSLFGIAKRKQIRCALLDCNADKKGAQSLEQVANNNFRVWAVPEEADNLTLTRLQHDEALLCYAEGAAAPNRLLCRKLTMEAHFFGYTELEATALLPMDLGPGVRAPALAATGRRDAWVCCGAVQHPKQQRGHASTSLECRAYSLQETPKCVDSDGRDARGHDCMHYSTYPWTCSMQDDHEFTANAMCCACKGKQDHVCKDTEGSRLDSIGNSCDEYMQHPEVLCHRFDDLDFSANEVCCACGGGRYVNGSAVAFRVQQAETVCRDTAGDATNSQGEDCRFYGHLSLLSCDMYDDDDFSAEDMCCKCGGGKSVEVAVPDPSTPAPTRTAQAAPAPAPARGGAQVGEALGCVDLSERKGAEHRDCAWFSSLRGIKSDEAGGAILDTLCGTYDTDFFSARDMCCACGGGKEADLEVSVGPVSSLLTLPGDRHWGVAVAAVQTDKVAVCFHADLSSIQCKVLLVDGDQVDLFSPPNRCLAASRRRREPSCSCRRRSGDGEEDAGLLCYQNRLQCFHTDVWEDSTSSCVRRQIAEGTILVDGHFSSPDGKVRGLQIVSTALDAWEVCWEYGASVYCASYFADGLMIVTDEAHRVASTEANEGIGVVSTAPLYLGSFAVCFGGASGSPGRYHCTPISRREGWVSGVEHEYDLWPEQQLLEITHVEEPRLVVLGECTRQVFKSSERIEMADPTLRHVCGCMVGATGQYVGSQPWRALQKCKNNSCSVYLDFSNGIDGPGCGCAPGFTGRVHWDDLGRPIGHCTAISCKANQSLSSTGSCRCFDGFEHFYESVSDYVNDNFSCQPAKCDVENSNGMRGTQCACKPGYSGTIVWFGDGPRGLCEPLPCEVPGSNQLPGDACACLDDREGSIRWQGDRATGSCTSRGGQGEGGGGSLLLALLASALGACAGAAAVLLARRRHKRWKQARKQADGAELELSPPSFQFDDSDEHGSWMRPVRSMPASALALSRLSTAELPAMGKARSEGCRPPVLAEEHMLEAAHYIFLSHYKVEAGTEAALMRAELEALIQQHEPSGHHGAAFDAPVFLDSEDLVDLEGLQELVRRTHNLVVLLTPGLLTRPWCIEEIVTGVRSGVNIVPVNVIKPGTEFHYPDEAFYRRLRSGGVLDRKAMDLLKEHGIHVEEVESAVRLVFKKIAVRFSPHSPKGVRQAELRNLLEKCSDQAWRLRPPASREDGR